METHNNVFQIGE